LKILFNIYIYRAILEEILLPLGAIWSHHSLLHKLKTSVVLFKPEVKHTFYVKIIVPTTTTKMYYYQAFPQVYNWTTYPLTVLLEQMYSQSKSRLATHNMKDTMVVELCSVAERALNYMHTGNVAVIATRVMNPLWIGRAIIQDGIPCINPKYVNIGLSSQLVIYAEQWPYNNSKYQPLTCSNRAQTLTYGDTHFRVSAKYIYFFVWHAINSAIQRLLTGGVFVYANISAVQRISNDGVLVCPHII
jgi:hypothetical protein